MASTGQAPAASQAVRELIARCLDGDQGAARAFQEQYGEIIYGYPMRVYRIPPEEAGDFYVFAFEGGRIFRRLRTYEGRAPFPAYLVGFVLDDLVLEWKRGERSIETISMEDVGTIADPQPGADADPEQSMDHEILSRLLDGVEPTKLLVLKLLHVEDYDLTPSEFGHIASASGRSFSEVVAGVDRLRQTVREREARVKEIDDQLDAVQAWIGLYERRLRRVRDEIAGEPVSSPRLRRLQEEAADLDAKIRRRQAQKSKLVARAQRRKVTAPYREIAEILNTTVGNVGSQVARLRQELRRSIDS